MIDRQKDIDIDIDTKQGKWVVHHQKASVAFREVFVKASFGVGIAG